MAIWARGTVVRPGARDVRAGGSGGRGTAGRPVAGSTFFALRPVAEQC